MCWRRNNQRSTIYQLVRENYSPEMEIAKIHNILTNELFFFHSQKDSQQNLTTTQYLFFDFADKMLFSYLPEKGTCMNLAEFMARANAILIFGDHKNITDERIQNFLEVIENLLHLYFRNERQLKKRMGYGIYESPYKKLVFLMTTLENYLKLRKRKSGNKVTLIKG